MQEYINKKTDIDFWFLLFLKKLKDEKRSDFLLSEIYRDVFFDNEMFLDEFQNDASPRYETAPAPLPSLPNAIQHAGNDRFCKSNCSVPH